MIEERTNKDLKKVDDKSFEMFLFYVEKSINFLMLTSVIEKIIRGLAEHGELEPLTTALDDETIYELLNIVAEKDNDVSSLQKEIVSFEYFLKVFVVCSKNCVNRQVYWETYLIFNWGFVDLFVLYSFRRN